MQDNFTGDTAELLIRYMDNELSTDEQATVENLLETDASAREQYQFFLAAKSAVRSEGTRQRVAGIQQGYLADRNTKDAVTVTKKKRSSFTSFMSVAAVLAFLLIGYGTFQYLTTTNQKVYDDAYVAYQLPVNRGNEKTANIEEQYNAGDYKAAIQLFSASADKSAKEYFIAGLSYLQLNNAKAAIDAFQQLETMNAGSERKMYAQETDYYLMLAYLKAKNIEKSEQKLDKIRSDKGHLFYNKAGNISRTKLAILKWKEK